MISVVDSHVIATLLSWREC